MKTYAQAKARNDARRAKGLCLGCPLPSVRFRFCHCCRMEKRAKQRTYCQRYYRRHRGDILARMREAYHAKKAA